MRRIGFSLAIFVILLTAVVWRESDAGAALASKVLVWGTTEINANLDPALARSPEIIPMIGIYEGLVRFRPGTHRIEGQLAESWKMLDPGNFEFTLRKGIKFHDGTPFDAKAVKFSLDRMLTTNRGTAFLVSGYLEPRGIEVVDNFTVRFHLKKPYVGFPNILGSFPAWIVSPPAVEKWGSDFDKHATGTGPFKLVDWVPDEKLELVRNNDYWDKTRTPKLNRIIIKFFAESSSLKIAVERGDVDVAYRSIATSDVPSLKANARLKYLEQPGFTRFLFFSFRHPYTRDRLVRQAIAYAINYDRVMATQDGRRACSFFLCGTTVDVSYFSRTFKYEPQKARSLLAQAGYPNGIPETLTFWYTTTLHGPEETDVVAIIQSNLRDVGIRLDVKSGDLPSLIRFLNEGTVQLATFSFGAQNPDPAQTGEINYHAAGGNAVRMGWADPEASRLVDAANVETSQARRVQMYRELQLRFDPLVHKLPMFTAMDRVFLKNSVKGLSLTPPPLWWVFDLTQLDKE
jgi:peptide/nickel transport system substrate-binding protein